MFEESVVKNVYSKLGGEISAMVLKPAGAAYKQKKNHHDT